MAIATWRVTSTYDGVTLDVQVDDRPQFGEGRILSVTCSNQTGMPTPDGQTYPPRTVRVWATYKGTYLAQEVPAGTTRTWAPTGNRSVGDVTEVGIS